MRLASPIALIALLLAAGCGERRELREWTPADHQPAPEGAGVPDEAEPPPVGASLFAVHCATCHGLEGRGDGPGAPPMATVPDLTDPARAARRSDVEVEVLIRSGRGFMPGFEGSIPPEGIRALVSHVRTLAPPAAVDPAPEAPAPEGAPPEGAPPEAPN